MKYIKTYENIKDKKYWLMPLDNTIEDSLNQINAPIDFIKQTKRYINSPEYKKYIFVINNPGNFFEWSTFSYDGEIPEIPNDQLEMMDYKYYGIINMSLEDLELDKNMNKYNL